MSGRPATGAEPEADAGVTRLGPPPEPDRPQELAQGVVVVPFAVPFPPGTVTVIALEDAIGGVEGWTLVDSGLAANRPALERLIAGRLGGRPIFRVIATHFHPDHIGLAGWLQSTRGAELWTTRTSWLQARMLQLDGWTTPPEAARAFQRRAGFDGAMLARYETRAQSNFSVTVSPLPLGYRRIAAGDAIEIGARRWRVLIGDGHAPEHALLYDAEGDLLLAGDQILPEISPNIGVYPTEPEADPLGDWLESCDWLAHELSDATTVAPGHGPIFRGAATRAAVMAARARARLDRLAAHLAERPRTVVESFAGVYRRPIPEAAEGLATVETLAHLNRLTAEGRAAREARPDGVWFWRAV